jgi:hypothetical protein
MKYVLIFGVSLFILASCRFDRPLFASYDHNYRTQDTVTHDSIVRSYYKFLCFRKGITIGGYTLDKTYDTRGHLIKKGIGKEAEYGMCDGNNRFYIKTINYDTLGHVTKIHCTIRQNFGRAGVVVFDRTIVKTERYNDE